MKNFKLRLSLLRIWFMKNILVFIQIAIAILFVCTFTGAITDTTPIFGKVIYPVFKPLIDAINEVIFDQQIDSFMSFITVSLSLLMTIGLFLVKARSIAQTDIKSSKMKLALVKANLYFNENGKLTKKVEKMTKTDIDGDGDVNGEPTVNKGFFSGIKRAFEEFITIATAKFDKEDENKSVETYNETLEKADLKDTAEAIGEVKESIKEDLPVAAADFIVSEPAKEETEEEIILNEKTEEEKEEKVKKEKKKSFLIRFFQKIFKKKEKKVITEEAETVLENNMENDNEVKEEEKPVEETKIEATEAPTITEVKVVEIKEEKKEEKPINQEENSRAAFLANLRRR